MTTIEITERVGHILEVPFERACEFCGASAEWNGPTIFRSWAYMCAFCEPLYHVPPGRTGVDVGQRLVLAGWDDDWDAESARLARQTEHECPRAA